TLFTSAGRASGPGAPGSAFSSATCERPPPATASSPSPSLDCHVLAAGDQVLQGVSVAATFVHAGTNVTDTPCSPA
ncbi:hypothetical protein AB0C40_35765, partial [Streptomyces brevispora]|uniref:hypothetical protein n=1 Tax=Streptomyces brevispora TaxID=887462 RepID=UPI0033F80C27